MDMGSADNFFWEALSKIYRAEKAMKQCTLFFLILVALSNTASARGIDFLFHGNNSQSFGQLVRNGFDISDYHKSYAVVTGVSDYKGGFSSLSNTQNDAIRIKDYLIDEAGFDYVHLLTEDKVTYARLHEVMSNEMRKLVRKNDRFVFYWSGHGVTRKLDQQQFGYLPLKSSSKGEFDTMLEMKKLVYWGDRLRAKQTLYLFDASLSGLAGYEREWRSNQTIQQIARPSRQIFTAGLPHEEPIAGTAYGGSLFTTAVIDGLRGEADSSTSNKELEIYVRQPVSEESRRLGHRRLTPALQSDLGGDFFFLNNEYLRQKLDKGVHFSRSEGGYLQHSHNGRVHSHILPRNGSEHKHNGGASSNQGDYSNQHSHNGITHSHPHNRDGSVHKHSEGVIPGTGRYADLHNHNGRTHIHASDGSAHKHNAVIKSTRVSSSPKPFKLYPISDIQDQMAEFPWPPPESSGMQSLSAGFLNENTSLSRAAFAIHRALATVGQHELRYYFVPNGFAIVTRMEFFDQEGNTVTMKSVDEIDFIQYVKGLFWMPSLPGYYSRMLVFIVTDRRFATTGMPMDKDTADSLFSKGFNELPYNYSFKKFSKEHRVTALTYEFVKNRKAEGASLIVPGKLSAFDHLKKVGWYSAAKSFPD